MKIHAYQVLFATLLFVSLSDGANGRRRCSYGRLCIKCSMFVNSQYHRSKRSLFEENELDTTENYVIGNERGHHTRKAAPVSWIAGNTEVPDLKSDDRDEFDVTHNLESTDKPQMLQESKVQAHVRLSRTHAKSKPRKRSASSMEMCIRLLKTRCCKAYANMATYIGYKLRH